MKKFNLILLSIIFFINLTGCGVSFKIGDTKDANSCSTETRDFIEGSVMTVGYDSTLLNDPSLKEQPLVLATGEHDNVRSTAQSILNTYGDPKKGIIQVIPIGDLTYSDGAVMFESFIRNGLDKDICNLNIWFSVFSSEENRELYKLKLNVGKDLLECLPKGASFPIALRGFIDESKAEKFNLPCSKYVVFSNTTYDICK